MCCRDCLKQRGVKAWEEGENERMQRRLRVCTKLDLHFISYGTALLSHEMALNIFSETNHPRI